MIFQTPSFDIHFNVILFKIDSFTFIELTIIMPVFDLGMSFEKVRCGKRPEIVGKLYSKLCRNPV